MKIRIEFLNSQSDDVYDVARVPCVGELVCLGDDCHEVKLVMHLLNKNPETQVQAIVRAS